MPCFALFPCIYWTWIFQSWQVQVLGQMVWLWEGKLVDKSFYELSQRPTNITVEQTSCFEKYLLSIYYPHMTDMSDLNFQRMQDFEHSVHSNLRLLPASKAGQTEHIKRAAFETGWVAYECRDVPICQVLNYGAGNLQKIEHFCQSGKKLKIPLILKGW